ncbi:DUF5689 domain-containing protein [Flaviaesturariibacter amylovorans]|uniref:DUF5689 domain-containing protein n=1 Tax=Flaviaesturariibacter amylovorans TaxID=1084520 RepID=A0ABP8GIQ0_9BACT
MNRISVKNLMAAAYVLLLGTVVLSSCKRTYDDPPPTGAPGIVANITIRDLKAMDTAPYSVVHITQDLVISGVVNMDDKSGNYYQQISMQDSTGGIILRLAGSNLNTSYPVGRQLFVKVKDLYLGEYGGMLQLGGGADSIEGGVTMLSPVLQDRHIIKGAFNQPILPKVVSVTDLTTNRQDRYANTLIQLVDYQFAAADTTKGYADIGAAGNRVANQNCATATNTRITVRTSDFSNFATSRIPSGRGTLAGIYSFFGSTKQLTLRDTNDVQFNNPRCTSGGTGGGGGGTSAPTFTLTGTSPYTINFNNLASGLPAGVRIGSASTATTNDTGTVFNPITNIWSGTGGGWKNLASATGAGITQGSDLATQDASSDRALGIRQTSTIGDPGATLTFILANTTGRNNLKLEFGIQSLDPSVTRSTAWTVEYALGDSPTSWTAVTPASGSTTTGNLSWGNSNVTVNLPAAVANQSGKVWIRIVAKTATSGGGSRPVTAFDNIKFSWS